MPKLPGGGMQMPGGFMPQRTQIGQMPPNIQSILQAITSGAGGQPSPMPPTNQQGDNSAGGGGFWNPNDGVQRPTIGNTPATTNPTSPFAMPQNNPMNGGVPPPPSGGNNRWTNFISPPQSPNFNIK